MSAHPFDGLPPDTRAKDVLGRLPPRRYVGQRLAERVGARGWAVPPFASGRGIYERLGLPNPWDPDAKKTETGLGDVGIPTARQPAPHLTPPQSAKPAAASKPPAWNPNIGSAPPRRESSESGVNPALRIGEVRKADPSEFRPKAEERPTRPQAPPPRPPSSGTFGPGAPVHAVARLPVRPGVQVPGAAPPPPVAPAPAAAAPVAPNRPTPPPPVETQLPPPPAEAAPPRPPPPPAAPVNRKPPGTGGGLDDLFGMGATGDNTRIRMPRAEPEGEAARPRRPVVTSPDELARLGLDRRPPAAPPPAAPAGPAPSAKPSGDSEK